MIRPIFQQVNRLAACDGELCGTPALACLSERDSAADAARLATRRQRFPELRVFRRRGDDGIALPAEAAVELGVGEELLHLRLAASRDQRQAVECTGERAVGDEFVRAAEQPGNLQARIIGRTRKSKTA